MPRRGRSASPPPRMASRPSPAPARSAPRSPVPVQPQASSMMQSPVGGQQPGLLKQMAVTAGGVAVGSAMGHVVGHALVGGGGGGGAAAEHGAGEPAQTAAQPNQQHQENVCGFEMRQFLQCAQNQSDLSLCEGFNVALRDCRQSQGFY